MLWSVVRTGMAIYLVSSDNGIGFFRAFGESGQFEYSRHRSPIKAPINVICGLIAYCHQPKKPSLHMEWALPTSA